MAQQVYSWIVKPAAADLAASNIKKYAIAITPGLQLIQPKAIAGQKLRALTAGLTESRFGFPALEYVSQELNTIQSQVNKFVKKRSL